ncbi:hypothetical protein [Bacillus wiedmannii]|uniref:hypothetical protein n=1 Tax=Bacillus wiedmannii TaxID=1890302 RepID=UPI000BF2BBA3|nr:hypothetical protein [Bacillus wiedmannii]PFY96967.1 hypothetical protein COL57_15830 [Bacillus wiedmannii]
METDKIHPEELKHRVKFIYEDLKKVDLQGDDQAAAYKKLLLEYVMSFDEDNVYLDEYLNDSLLSQNVIALDIVLKRFFHIQPAENTIEMIRKIKMNLVQLNTDSFSMEARKWRMTLNSQINTKGFDLENVKDNYHFLLTCFGTIQEAFVKDNDYLDIQKMLLLYNSWLFETSLHINSIIAFLLFLQCRLGIQITKEILPSLITDLKLIKNIAHKMHENFIKKNEAKNSIKKNGPHAELIFKELSNKLLANNIHLNSYFKGKYM